MSTNSFGKVLTRGGMAASLLFSIGALAQGNSGVDFNLNPELAAPPEIATDMTMLTPAEFGALKTAWGTQQGASWTAATEFTASTTANAPNLHYEGFHFYQLPGGGTGTNRFFAQLQAPTGALISHLACVFRDTHATTNVTFGWQEYTADVSGSDTRTANIIATATTSGTPGIGFLTLNGPATMTSYDGLFQLTQHYIAVDISGVTSFAGCWAFWNRQVAPAPGVATFNDVPTGHTFFQSVEALAASGITGGCGGGNYCPNNTVTRGQMAAFLARAFGLGFPY